MLKQSSYSLFFKDLKKQEPTPQVKVSANKTVNRKLSTLIKFEDDANRNNQSIANAAHICKSGKAALTDLQPFLHTDIDKYLAKKQKPSTCISCLNCLKKENTLISYKYKPNLESSYTANYTNTPPYPNAPFVIDAERKKVKTAYPRPATKFQTSYSDNYS